MTNDMAYDTRIRRRCIAREFTYSNCNLVSVRNFAYDCGEGEFYEWVVAWLGIV